MAISLGLLAAILLSIGAGGILGGTAGVEDNKGLHGDTYVTGKTWFSRTTDKELGKAFLEYAASQGENIDFLSGMTPAQIGNLLRDRYEDDSWNFLGFGNEKISFDDALAQAKELQGYRIPTPPDYSQIYAQAEQDIANENAEIEAMYDELLNQQTTNLNQQMSDLNESYQDATNQILSSDYIKNRQLMDAATSELSRSRRNALEAGASAGLRLANNVNTMLSVQNQQAQQSLETSNNLAQMMLNQRQAASGIRNDYYNALANDTNSRAALKQGTFERVGNAKRLGVELADAEYQNKLDNWNSALDLNAWKGNYLTYQNKLQQKNKYYGG